MKAISDRPRVHGEKGLALLYHVHLRLSLIAVLALVALPLHAAQTVVDDLGRRMVLPHGVQRIVALDPSVVEILFAVGAGGKIVGTTSYANYPPAVSSIPKFNALEPSRELLISLRPDLIVLSDQTMTVQKADARARLYGFPVFVTNANSYAGVERDIALLGGYFGDPKLARKVNADMENALADVRKRVAHHPKVTVFDVVWCRPLMTAGKDSFVSNLVALAGGVDIAADAPKYSEYSTEKLVALNPTFILVAQESLSAARAALRGLGLGALRTGRLRGLNDDTTVRPGPRLAIGLEEVARILHPEAFAK